MNAPETMYALGIPYTVGLSDNVEIYPLHAILEDIRGEFRPLRLVASCYRWIIDGKSDGHRALSNPGRLCCTLNR